LKKKTKMPLNKEEIKIHIDNNQIGQLEQVLNKAPLKEIVKLTIPTSVCQHKDVTTDTRDVMLSFVDLNPNTELNLLEYAVYQGKEQIVDFLLEQKFFPLSFKNAYTKQAFEFAFQERHIGIIQSLIRALDHSDADTLLLQAITESLHDDKFIAEYLHRHFNLSLDPFLLSRAIIKKKPLTACYLAHFVQVNTQNGEGFYPIHYAAQTGQLEVIETLYQQGADLRVKTKEGKTIFDLIPSEQKETLQKLVTQLQNREHLTTLSFKKPEQIENIVLKGGGIKGLAYTSAILEAQRQGLIDPRHIKRVGGASAGAIAALFLALGYSPEEMQQKMDEMSFETMLDTEHSAFKNFILEGHWNFTNFLQLLIAHSWSASGVCAQLGICQGEVLRLWLNLQIKERISQLLNRSLETTEYNDFTFKELHDFTLPNDKKPFKALAVVGTNITTGRSEIYSYEKTPHLCVADAVRISAGFPIAFVPHYKYEKRNGVRTKVSDHLCVDGGMLDNFPIKIFDNGDYNPKTLGFGLVSEKHQQEFLTGQPQDVQAKDGFSHYLGRLLSTMRSQQDDLHAKSGDQPRTVYIDHHGTPTLQFNLPDKQRKTLIQAGSEGVRDFLNRRKPNLLWYLSPHTITTLINYQVLCPNGFKLVPTDTRLSAKQIYVLYAEAEPREIYALREIINPNLYRSEHGDNGNSPLHYAHVYANTHPSFGKSVKNLWSANANPYTLNTFREQPSQATQEHAQLSWEELPFLQERNQELLHIRTSKAQQEKESTLDLTKYFDQRNRELEGENTQLKLKEAAQSGRHLAEMTEMEQRILQLQKELDCTKAELANLQTASKLNEQQFRAAIQKQKRKAGDKEQLSKDLDRLNTYLQQQSSNTFEKAKVVKDTIQTLIQEQVNLTQQEIRHLTQIVIGTYNLLEGKITIESYQKLASALLNLPSTTFFSSNKFKPVSNAMWAFLKTLPEPSQHQRPRP
jgi:NTE family protein